MLIFKMADVSHVVFHVRLWWTTHESRRDVDGVSFVIKFWTDWVYGFLDIAIFRFWQFGLKMPIHAPFEWVFGAQFPQIMSLIILTPKGPSLGGTTSFEP